MTEQSRIEALKAFAVLPKQHILEPRVAGRYPQHTIFNAKRFIGRRLGEAPMFQDCCVSSEASKASTQGFSAFCEVSLEAGTHAYHVPLLHGPLPFIL